MQIAIPIYPAFTALDAIGPYEVLQRVPGAEVVFCSTAPGIVRTDQGMLGSSADRSLDEVERPDVVVVPGGVGTAVPARSRRSLPELDRARPRDVCLDDIGLHRIAAARRGRGPRRRRRHHATGRARGLLGELGANPVAERVVERGKVITAAGVSSGIDMALTLAGRIAGAEVAQAIQLGIEYDPDPPHDTGSLEKAPAKIVEMTGIALAAEDGRAAVVHSLV